MLIEVGQSVAIDDPDGAFTVTAFDANHCPGAVMFLFEGNFGNILHTGDCRLTPECLQNLPEKYVGKKGRQPLCQLDYVFLDCTFGKASMKMPSKHNAVQQVINCIWKHPNTPLVYLTCDLLGQEEVLVDVSKTFGSKIYIDSVGNPDCFMYLTLTAPEIISQDPASRFQLLDGFPRLYERAQAKIADAQASSQPVPLIIRPSAQWYALEDESLDAGHRNRVRINEAVKDVFGVWHVCYSMHSSREELEWALLLLAPKHVVSTTPDCRAMELDYVKKKCFNRVSSDDPLWKVMDISMKVMGSSTSESQLQTVDVSMSKRELHDWSPPIKRPLVTLFGRARVGLPQEMTKSMDTRGSQSLKTYEKELETITFHNGEGVKLKSSSLCVSGIEGGCGKSVEKESKVHVASVGTEGSHSLRTVENKQETLLLHNEEGVKVKSTILCASSVDNEHAKSTENKESKVHAASSDTERSHSLRKDDRKRETSSLRNEEGAVELESNRSLWVSSNEGGHATLGERKESNEHIISSYSFSENMRKLYRSKNVPVPRPLPSLLQLRNATKKIPKNVTAIYTSNIARHCFI